MLVVVLAVQVTPSGEDAQLEEPAIIATNPEPPYVTHDQNPADGIVRAVQVMPSVEDIAPLVVPLATATYVAVPYAAAL
jgi:hypothetical protein